MSRRGIQALIVFGVFALLTVAATWPQAQQLATRTTPHQDVFFNMWRLRWFAHALATSPAHLFDANIFYPESTTLAFSDAMIVEGLAGAPLLWAGMRPLLVHNLLLFGAIAACGTAMFALARYLTGSRGAGIIAGIVFAYGPYRFEHIMHMELQWVMWAPLAFLSLHRTLDTGRWRYGLATGALVALQMLSSIYYGIFLATLLGAGAVLLIARDRAVALRRALVPLAAGAILAAVVSGLYARPYLAVRDRVGERSTREVSSFSARASNYLVATPNNWFYGRAFASRGRPERRLFPGTIPVVLALIGLLLRVPSRRSIVYLLLLVAAFETSLGFHGYSYTFLYDYVPAYRGLRAAARLGAFVLMFVAVLAAYGYAALAEARSVRVRAVIVGLLSLGLLAEYRVEMEFSPYANTAPPIYRFLGRHPRGVVAEFPMPSADALPGYEPDYAYMSSFHWFPLVNGYSGIYPQSYLDRLEQVRHFPDATSLRQLRLDGVRYVVVHVRGYLPADYLAVRAGMLRSGSFVELGSYYDADAPAVLYEMR